MDRTIGIYNDAKNASTWQIKHSIEDLTARPFVLESLKQLPKSKRKSLLDVGCGTGRWTKKFAEHFENVTGVDISPQMLEIAESQSKEENIDYILGDFLTPCLDPKRFSVVTALAVFQHLANRTELESMFKNIHSVLVPEGDFIFYVPHPLGPFLPSSDWIKYSLPEGKSYRDGTFFQVELSLIEGGIRKAEGYVHTLEDYTTALNNAGFKIAQIYEPLPSQETLEKYPQLKGIRCPSSLVIKSKKEDVKIK